MNRETIGRWAFIIGLPLPTYQIAKKKLNKIRTLAAFSPNALSSIAYANQEIYLGLGGSLTTGELVLVERSAGRLLSMASFARWCANWFKDRRTHSI